MTARYYGYTIGDVTYDQKVALSISDIIAVMVGGRLEQVGSAKEIYETPRTKLIADFMGASNIFPGKVRGKDGKKVQLETEAGLEGDNKFRGKIVEMIYQGNFIEMKVVLGQAGEQITANLSSRLDQKSQFSPGEEALVHWNQEGSNVLLG